MIGVAGTALAGEYPEYPCGWQWLSLDNTAPYELNPTSDYQVTSVAVNTKEHSCFWLTPEVTSKACYTATWLDGDHVVVESSGVGFCQDIEVVEFYGHVVHINYLPLVYR